MKALFAHPRVVASPDEEMLDLFLRGGYGEEGERTLFAGVKRLPAAYAMLVSGAGAITRIWRYWTPTFLERGTDCDQAADIEQFR